MDRRQNCTHFGQFKRLIWGCINRLYVDKVSNGFFRCLKFLKRLFEGDFSKSLFCWPTSIHAMDIIKHIQTGRDFNELCQEIGRYVYEQRKGASKFKIGITTDYNHRAEGDDYLLNGYNRMIVLYQTQSKERVCSMEQYLIKRFQKYEECENIRPGGEGKLKWGPPYYAYLAMKIE